VSDSQRRGVAPAWVLGALLLSFLGAFGVAVVIYQRYVAFERRAARHLVGAPRLAVRADLEKIALYAPFRERLLPLVQGTQTDPRLKPRLIRLSQHTGVELGVDVREIVYSRGERPETWVLAMGGMFPKTGVVAGLHEVLVEEGHEYAFDAATQRLQLPNHVVVQQAADSVVLFASDPEALESALDPSDRYQALELGLGAPALCVAVVAATPGDTSARLNASVSAEDPGTLKLALREAGRALSAEETREFVTFVSRVTGLSTDSIHFKVTGPSQRVATVPITSEHLSQAAERWATLLRTAAFPAR